MAFLLNWPIFTCSNYENPKKMPHFQDGVANPEMVYSSACSFYLLGPTVVRYGWSICLESSSSKVRPRHPLIRTPSSCVAFTDKGMLLYYTPILWRAPINRGLPVSTSYSPLNSGELVHHLDHSESKTLWFCPTVPASIQGLVFCSCTIYKRAPPCVRRLTVRYWTPDFWRKTSYWPF